MKHDIGEQVGGAIKNVVTKMIKYMSVIAIFLVLAIVAFTSLGAEFSLSGFLKSGFGVPSVLLAIGTIFLYELWLKNGQAYAKTEEDYRECIKEFQLKSKGISVDRMQLFIDAEKQRRYKVEEKRILKEIENIDKMLEKKKMSKAGRKRLLLKRQRLEDHVIVVKMPYKVSEEIDGLRYSIKEDKKREYSPKDTNRFVLSQRIRKYLMTFFFSFFSINVIVMGAINNQWLQTIIALLAAIVAVVMAVVTGYLAGYRSIATIAFGVYSTANDFIDKAIYWCTKEGFSLYYAEDEEEKTFARTISMIPYIVDEPDDYYRPELYEVFGRPEVIIE